MNEFTLHLVLIKKWFDRHLEDKTEEYREVTPHWCNRLLVWNSEVKSKRFWNNRMDDFTDKTAVQAIQHYILSGEIQKRYYSEIIFSHGMKPMDVLPRFERNYLTLGIGNGKKEWGGTDNPVFVLSCGEIRNKTNC